MPVFFSFRIVSHHVYILATHSHTCTHTHAYKHSFMGNTIFSIIHLNNLLCIWKIRCTLYKGVFMSSPPVPTISISLRLWAWKSKMKEAGKKHSNEMKVELYILQPFLPAYYLIRFFHLFIARVYVFKFRWITQYNAIEVGMQSQRNNRKMIPSQRSTKKKILFEFINSSI